MSDKSTTITRPRPTRSADDGRSSVGDPTRGVRRDRRLAPQGANLALFLLGTIIVGALTAALFLLPIRTYFDQDDRIEQRTEQLERIEAVVADLQAEVDRLGTDEGVAEAAREELGFVESGERRQTISELPPVPADLPPGWPYDLVSDIATLRGVVPTPVGTVPLADPDTDTTTP